MQIKRFLSLNEAQFLGCASAFLDALSSELESAQTFLDRLAGSPKGRAFAFEMQLDKNRYGALIVLERWSDFAATFSDHAVLGLHQSLITEAQAKSKQASQLIEQANQAVDAASSYSQTLVEAYRMLVRTVLLTFADERAAVTNYQNLGPMMAEDYKEYRAVFQNDLSAR